MHYNVSVFCNGSLNKSMINRNVIGRVRNCLVEAINEHVLLPKFIIVILEDDLIRAVHHYSDGISNILSTLTKWMASEFHKLLSAHKESLPTKARKFKYPQVLWTAAVHNKSFSANANYYRKKFNTCLLSVAESFREMEVAMLHTWDMHDRSLVSDCKINAKGKETFWSALDNSLQKIDRDQMNKKHLAEKLLKSRDSSQLHHGIQRRGKGGNVKYHKKKQDRFHSFQKNFKYGSNNYC